MDRKVDDEEAFLNAFDRREAERIESSMRGLGTSSPHVYAENKRVRALLAEDQAYRESETRRTEALLQMENGEFANIEQSVSGPTREQIAQGERTGRPLRPFTPRQPDRTVRTVTAYRRHDLPQVQRMVLNGTIDGNGLRDCIWYRNLHEAAGLAGNIPSVDLGREVFSAPNSRTAFTEQQIEKQDLLRCVRAGFDPRGLRLLDMVVLDDVPFSRAFRALGYRTRRMRFDGAARGRALFEDLVHHLGQQREHCTRTGALTVGQVCYIGSFPIGPAPLTSAGPIPPTSQER